MTYENAGGLPPHRTDRAHRALLCGAGAAVPGPGAAQRAHLPDLFRGRRRPAGRSGHAPPGELLSGRDFRAPVRSLGAPRDAGRADRRPAGRVPAGAGLRRGAGAAGPRRHRRPARAGRRPAAEPRGRRAPLRALRPRDPAPAGRGLRRLPDPRRPAGAPPDAAGPAGRRAGAGAGQQPDHPRGHGRAAPPPPRGGGTGLPAGSALFRRPAGGAGGQLPRLAGWRIPDRGGHRRRHRASDRQLFLWQLRPDSGVRATG